jgi:hypothetical protein
MPVCTSSAEFTNYKKTSRLADTQSKYLGLSSLIVPPAYVTRPQISKCHYLSRPNAFICCQNNAERVDRIFGMS